LHFLLLRADGAIPDGQIRSENNFVPLIWLVISRDREAPGKYWLDCCAPNPATAALAASARVCVAARRMGRARAQSDPGRRHLRLRWSAALAVFNYWFDGLTTLAAIVAALIPRALRETQSQKDHATWAGNVVRGIFIWVLLVGIVGLPYWIVLIPLHDLLLGDELRRELAHSPALWVTFGSLAASHFWKAFRVGYDMMPDKELKQRVRWDVYLLILRAMAMFMMAAQGLVFILVPLMALMLSYLEIWPARAIDMVFGDPSRLWEYDPDSSTSSRGRR
jgi:hypothetical protein